MRIAQSSQQWGIVIYRYWESASPVTNKFTVTYISYGFAIYSLQKRHQTANVYVQICAECRQPLFTFKYVQNVHYVHYLARNIRWLVLYQVMLILPLSDRIMIIIIITWLEKHQAVIKNLICVQTNILVIRLEYCYRMQLFYRMFLSGYEALVSVLRT